MGAVCRGSTSLRCESRLMHWRTARFTKVAWCAMHLDACAQDGHAFLWGVSACRVCVLGCLSSCSRVIVCVVYRLIWLIPGSSRSGVPVSSVRVCLPAAPAPWGRQVLCSPSRPQQGMRARQLAASLVLCVSWLYRCFCCALVTHLCMGGKLHRRHNTCQQMRYGSPPVARVSRMRNLTSVLWQMHLVPLVSLHRCSTLPSINKARVRCVQSWLPASTLHQA